MVQKKVSMAIKLLVTAVSNPLSIATNTVCLISLRYLFSSAVDANTFFRVVMRGITSATGGDSDFFLCDIFKSLDHSDIAG